MAVIARMLPRNVESTPRVVELPTSQKTLHACAPLVSRTVLFEPVIRVEPALKIQIAFGFPPPSSVTVVATLIELGALYTPGVNVWVLSSATAGRITSFF